jgi:diguanylate cyclase (GGDEF)-like protein
MKVFDIKQELANWLIEDRDPSIVRRLRILTPLISVIFLAIVVLAISLFYIEAGNQSRHLIFHRLNQTQKAASDFYYQEIQNDVNALRIIIQTLKRDGMLQQLFASRDRKAILRYVQTHYSDLKGKFGISHFYFTLPDRVNLLRVHAPSRYGDKIDRVTTLQAEKQGSVAHGVELGILGTFTLRVVSPWYDEETGTLIGYVELGMEIDHIIKHLNSIFGHDIIILVFKEFLDRKEWESGMRELGRAVDWDQFDKAVLIADVTPKIPTTALKQFEQYFYVHPHVPTPLEHEGIPYWFISTSLHDVSGREVADMMLLVDVSLETEAVNTTVIIVGATVFLVGLAFVFFFSWQMTRAGQRIEQDEKILKQFAIHDPLTKLFTRRVFHDYLDSEIDRSSRFKHPLSLLMVDLDYFKKVNDEYGHQAGDKVLQEVSERLIKSVRTVDYVFRYGGEEIAILLPETDTDTAQQFAQRINDVISALPVDVGNHQLVSITVSIGIATYPEHADSDTLLISASDKALYAAKNAGRDRICVYSLECE